VSQTRIEPRWLTEQEFKYYASRLDAMDLDKLKAERVEVLISLRMIEMQPPERQIGHSEVYGMLRLIERRLLALKQDAL